MKTAFNCAAEWVVVLVVLTVCLCVHGKDTSNTSQQSQHEKIPIEASFCQLVARPGLYNGKEVVVQATYNGGNEWSVLSSPGCSSDRDLVWLECSNERVREEVKLGLSRESVTFDLRVRGIFMSGGKYGHRGRYSYKIIANEVSKVGRAPDDK
jgi:hypothetical protein